MQKTINTPTPQEDLWKREPHSHALSSKKNAKHPTATGDFTELLTELTFAAKTISREVNKAGLADVLGLTGRTNIHGETVQKLDELSNTIIIQAVDHTGHLAGMASEEMDDIYHIPDRHPLGKYKIMSTTSKAWARTRRVTLDLWLQIFIAICSKVAFFFIPVIHLLPKASYASCMKRLLWPLLQNKQAAPPPMATNGSSTYSPKTFISESHFSSAVLTMLLQLHNTFKTTVNPLL